MVIIEISPRTLRMAALFGMSIIAAVVAVFSFIWLLNALEYDSMSSEGAGEGLSTFEIAEEPSEYASDLPFLEYPLSVELMDYKLFPESLRPAIEGNYPFVVLKDESLLQLNVDLEHSGHISMHYGIPFFRQNMDQPSNLDKIVSVHIENATVWEALLELIKAMNCQPVWGKMIHVVFVTGYWGLVVQEFYEDQIIDLALDEVPAIDVLGAIAAQSVLPLSFAYSQQIEELVLIRVYAYKDKKKIQLTKPQVQKMSEEELGPGIRRRNINAYQVNEAVKEGQNCGSQ
jgi:hypothetical protein